MARADAGDALDKAPLAIREAMLFPYRAGLYVRRGAAPHAAVVRRRRRVQAAAALDRADPASREVPRRRAAGRRSTIELPRRCADYAIAHSTVWGEFGFDAVPARARHRRRRRREAAAGWGGDRAVVLAKADDTRRRASDRHRAARVGQRGRRDRGARSRGPRARRRDRSARTRRAHATTRTRWLGLDGTVTCVERRGTSIVIVARRAGCACRGRASRAVDRDVD